MKSELRERDLIKIQEQLDNLAYELNVQEDKTTPKNIKLYQIFFLI